MRKDGYVSVTGKWQLSEKELVQLEKDYIKRLYEIVNKAEQELKERR